MEPGICMKVTEHEFNGFDDLVNEDFSKFKLSVSMSMSMASSMTTSGLMRNL
jgi:hypothetical protein